MTTELPRTVPVGDVEEWSDEVDVVVVGAGMGGSAAAVEAARAGARVLVLDRGGPGTCTTAMAGGHFYLGGGTPVQEATGHEDSLPRRWRRTSARSAPTPTRRRSVSTARTRSSTSRGSRDWASSSSGRTTRR